MQISTFLDRPRLVDLAKDPLWSPERRKEDTTDKALAIIDSYRPRETRVDGFKRQAAAYAASMTRGLDATEEQRAGLAHRRLIELLVGALDDSQQALSEALGLLESEAKEIWIFRDKPVTQDVFETTWQSEQPDLFQQWKHLGTKLGRGQ
jgi:hypothetical protein